MAKAKKKVKVGFIGCGGIAQYHFGHFDKMREKADIVAACDLRPERTQATADRFGSRQYQDYRVMFEKEKLDAVFVCVEPGAHDGMEFIAIEKGINLFVQKPMTLDMKYAKKVLAGIKKNKLISAIGLQCRYPDTMPLIKNWISHKQIGLINCTRIGGFPMVWWWRVKKQSGGQAVEQTIHDFDLCRYFFGDVARVQSICRHGLITNIENNDVEDCSSTLITFKSGLIGTFSTGCFGSGDHNITAYATGNCKMTCNIFGTYTITEPNMTITGKASNDFGQENDETFIDAVSGAISRDEILNPYSEAIKTLAFVFAIDKSMQNGGIPVEPEL